MVKVTLKSARRRIRHYTLIRFALAPVVATAISLTGMYWWIAFLLCNSLLLLETLVVEFSVRECEADVRNLFGETLNNTTPTWDSFQTEVGTWAEKTFPEASTDSILLHLMEEAEELRDTINVCLQGHDDALEDVWAEVADIVLISAHAKHRSRQSLYQAVAEKYYFAKSHDFRYDPRRGYAKRNGHKDVTISREHTEVIERTPEE